MSKGVRKPTDNAITAGPRTSVRIWSRLARLLARRLVAAAGGALERLVVRERRRGERRRPDEPRRQAAPRAPHALLSEHRVDRERQREAHDRVVVLQPHLEQIERADERLRGDT
eukprot:CAMPEP_0195637100 /NCGR_PEP_ID=MMETSP0815-20121206/24236_1 /TAXON_ID=97485 /ORGANISM="Prymnesium parvum, Strain Texoma1" /LENGTH=113 /DNA_ID=CAMNT_0040779281 /DNA_START=679 /DNA_END=1017 /DNA_ORIENTATION=+